MYPTRLKNAVVNRILSEELTIAQAAEQFYLSPVLIKRWLDYPSGQAAAEAANTPDNQEDESVTRILLPKGYTYLQAHAAVVAKQLLSEQAFGEFLRKEGLLSTQVDDWEEWFSSNPDAVNMSDYLSLKSELNQEKSDHADADKVIAIQKKQIQKKDAALAEFAQLEILGKKYMAFREGKEE